MGRRNKRVALAVRLASCIHTNGLVFTKAALLTFGGAYGVVLRVSGCGGTLPLVERDANDRRLGEEKPRPAR
jgi:hypothetical protein